MSVDRFARAASLYPLPPDSPAESLPNKVARVTLLFWVMKICATTLGETAGDLLSMTLGLGYGASTLVLLGIFVTVLLLQIGMQRFHPPLYWLVILATSTAGTTLSDFIDRSLGLGYAQGAAILSALLCLSLALWRAVEGSLAVTAVATRRAESFYWFAILVSNTLGTALGDYLADDSGLGFAGAAFLIAALLALQWLLYRYSTLSRVALFWLAFVLTRPLGATLGDLLTKPTAQGGLDLGTIGSSATLLATLATLLAWSMWRDARTVTGRPG